MEKIQLPVGTVGGAFTATRISERYNDAKEIRYLYERFSYFGHFEVEFPSAPKRIFLVDDRNDNCYELGPADCEVHRSTVRFEDLHLAIFGNRIPDVRAL